MVEGNVHPELTNVTGGFAYIADVTGVGTIADNDLGAPPIDATGVGTIIDND